VTARGLGRRLLAGLRRRRAEAELEEEIGFHLQMETEENVRRGLPPERARRAAERSFGRRVQAVDAAHRARGLPWLEDVVTDAGLAVRTLRRAPAFAAAVILLIALAIAANTAVFTVVDGVMLRPLPYPAAEELVLLERFRADGREASHDGRLVEAVDRWSDDTQVVAAIARPIGLNLVRGALALHVSAEPVTHRFLKVLGVPPARGRDLEAADQRPGAAPVAVLSHDLARRMGGEPIGQRVMLGGVSHAVVGVLPDGLRLIPPADLLVPLIPGPDSAGTNFQVVARLRAGEATGSQRLAAAAAEMRERRVVAPDMSVRWIDLQGDLAAFRRPTLLLLFGAVGLVLLIACANVAGLLLVKAQRRSAELAVRAALGAGPGRLIRQLLVEGMVYALVGGLIGVGLAHVALEQLLRVAPPDLADWSLAIDGRVLLFALALTLVTGVTCALAPAVRASRVDLRAAVTGGASGVASSAPSGRWRRGLLVGQVALCTLLLVGAGVLLRTLVALRSVDPGFRTESIVALSMAPDQSGGALPDFYDRALDSASRVPGVRRIAVTAGMPGRRGLNLPVRVGRADDELGGMRAVNWRYVSPGYFELLGIPVEAGRALDERDGPAGEQVVVVNRAFARTYFPGADPIGQQVELARVPELPDQPRTIVGVVGDTRDASLVGEAEPAMFVAVAQVSPGILGVAHRFFDAVWLVDTDLPPAAAADRLGAVFRALRPDLPISEVTGLADVLGDHTAGERFLGWLLAAFALAALVIAVTGLYGLTATSVTQRSRELAIRMALGATPGRVVRGVLTEGLVVAAIGVGLGLAAAWPLAPLAAGVVTGAHGFDPVTSAAVAGILLGAALLASLVPAVRAARIDPLAGLRQG
jgi:predicted permease